MSGVEIGFLKSGWEKIGVLVVDVGLWCFVWVRNGDIGGEIVIFIVECVGGLGFYVGKFI